MPIRILSRLGAALFFAALASGCSTSSGPSAFHGSSGSSATRPSLQCSLAPSTCLYDGHYESGEKDYAEQEARRLNQAQLRRLRGF